MNRHIFQHHTDAAFERLPNWVQWGFMSIVAALILVAIVGALLMVPDDQAFTSALQQALAVDSDLLETLERRAEVQEPEFLLSARMAVVRLEVEKASWFDNEKGDGEAWLAVPAEGGAVFRVGFQWRSRSVTTRTITRQTRSQDQVTVSAVRLLDS